MPVWFSDDPTEDLAKNGSQRRHINADCPVYVANVSDAHKAPAKGRPNTERLRERTTRCEDPACWTAWEKEQAQKGKRAKRGSGTGKVSAAKAATTPPTKVGGKAANLADRARAARTKPKAKAKAAA